MYPFTADVSESVAHVGETVLVRRMLVALGASAPAAPEGPGDDCAVLAAAPKPGKRLVTTDAVIHGRHFDDSVSPEDAGRKLVRRNVSDIAAMGGDPTDAVIALLMGPDVSAAWLERFMCGVGEGCLESGVKLTGGDLAKMPVGIFAASLTLTGFAEKPMLRTGGRAGDFVYVTGSLGGSILGKHFSFSPRVAEGRFFAAHPAMRAGMDLTDGVAKDLPALIPAKCAAMVALGALPIAEDCRTLAARSGKSLAHHALTDGEDYELIVVVDAAGAAALETDFAKVFPDTPFTRVARIVPAAGLESGKLYDESGAEISEHGFDHFG
jgi:thiamine-monophosphate kinase